MKIAARPGNKFAPHLSPLRDVVLSFRKSARTHVSDNEHVDPTVTLFSVLA